MVDGICELPKIFQCCDMLKIQEVVRFLLKLRKRHDHPRLNPGFLSLYGLLRLNISYFRDRLEFDLRNATRVTARH